MLDLHTHTNKSDGVLTPLELIAKAKEANVSLLAITDHDTIDGVEPAQLEGVKLGIKVIPGCEITTKFHLDEVPHYTDTWLHMLAYGFDLSRSQKLKEQLASLRSNRQQFASQTMAKLQSCGFVIDSDDASAILAGNHGISRQLFAV